MASPKRLSWRARRSLSTSYMRMLGHQEQVLGTQHSWGMCPTGPARGSRGVGGGGGGLPSQDLDAGLGSCKFTQIYPPLGNGVISPDVCSGGGLGAGTGAHLLDT